jgi:hypothetical protein
MVVFFAAMPKTSIYEDSEFFGFVSKIRISYNALGTFMQTMMFQNLR